MLSGGYDNFQPDAKWIQARMGASTRWIHVPAASHGVRDKGMCVRDLIGAFLDEPSAALQTACLESMPAPAFLLHASANKGLTRLAVPLANGALPTNPLMLALAAAVASMLLVVGIGIHTWRQQQQTRRKVDYRVWLGAAANVLPVAAIAALFATMTPEKMAALAYGLPEHWDFIQWLVPLPALVALLNTLMRPKAKALWFLGLAGLTVTTALLVDGWFL